MESVLTLSEELTNPKRYTSNGIECWDFWIYSEVDPIVASAVKYVWRYRHKNGLEDLKKALVFLDKASTLDYLYVKSKDVYMLDISKLPDMTPLQILFMTQASLTVLNGLVYKDCISNMKLIVNKIIEEEYA